MQNTVIFNDGQDVDPTDFNNIQTFTKGSLDTLVYDAVSNAQRYAGLNVTKSTVTAVNVDVGRLYSAGKVYALATPVTQDFLTSLPVAGQKIVTIVIYGSEVDTDVVAREFLINETTGQSQPKPVATRHARVCNVQFAYGAEAPTATPPLVSAGYTAVADVLLAPTGIVSITMRSDNAVQNIDQLDDRLDSLELFEGVIGPKVTTLTSDLAALANQFNDSASANVLGQILLRVATLEAKDQIPTTSVSSYASYYLDPRDSDPTNPLSNCKIQEGIRFADSNANVSAIALFNPLDINAKTVNQMLLPAYTRKLWLSTGTASDQVRLSGYSYQTNSIVQQTVTQQVTNYGTPFTVCTNNAWWNTGKYDPVTNIFTINGATYNVTATAINYGIYGAYSGDWAMHNIVRLQQYWYSDQTNTYSSTVTVPHSVNGAFVAETFLQGQDMWLDAVGLYFTQLAASGDVTLAVCKVSSKTGLPDMTSVISYTNVPYSTLALAPNETQISITPTFLEAGNRYAVVVITAADHWVATVPGEQFTSGTFFYILDGAYAQGDGTKDLQMNLYRAVPKTQQVSLQLNPLSLAGGIYGITVLAGSVVPSNCQLSYEIQVSGTWYPLSNPKAYMLGQGGSVSPLLPFRVTMVGTGDIMPAINLNGAQVGLTCPKQALTHISTVYSIPSSAQIRVIQRYESYDSAYHTMGVKLRTGGTPAGGTASYTTLVSPSSFSDVTGNDPVAGKYLERTYVFNLGSAVTSYVVQTDNATTSLQKMYHVAWQKSYSL